MSAGAGILTRGRGVAARAGESLDSIAGSISAINGMATQFATAVEEQTMVAGRQRPASSLSLRPVRIASPEASTRNSP